MLDIEIDGKAAKVPDGSTVMEAAQRLGVYIPHFCHLRRIENGAGRPDDIDLLGSVTSNIMGRTVCALGDAAAMPVQEGKS
ncbi:MAG: (2Fe-2S)-binding protein [Zoogloeaceae bacterium]|jgi:hypothetical protein|nr:(2Fe-2S)-binding protein [Zoogloeaceae bacterium]